MSMRKSALMEQAIHTNTIAHYLMHHMAHGENNLKHLTVWLLFNLFVALYAFRRIPNEGSILKFWDTFYLFLTY